jgi:hypothetical protein
MGGGYGKDNIALSDAAEVVRIAIAQQSKMAIFDEISSSRAVPGQTRDDHFKSTARKRLERYASIFKYLNDVRFSLRAGPNRTFLRR